MTKIDFFNTDVHPEAFVKVSEVLQSTFLSEGKLVADFESALSHQLGILNPVAVNSGTAALHLALVVAGIGIGDEVIIPSQTFIATGLAVMMTGAVPVFADIQLHTGNIDPADVERKISPKTKAVMPVHWGGYPCEMDQLIEIATRYNLLVIEDAAHAIGAKYKGNFVGALGDMTCFSFQAIKHLTTGDGGLLACKDQNHFERAMVLRWFGIDRKNSPIGSSGEREYNLKELGYKYHLNNYAAALGLANLEVLSANLKRRREIAEYYNTELKDVPGLDLFSYDQDKESSYWLYGFHVEKRDAFISKLASAGIPSSVVHVGIHKNELFTHDSVNTLHVQNAFDKSQVHIPVHNGLSNNQTHAIIKAIKAGW
jgi:perosamine synthetase